MKMKIQKAGVAINNIDDWERLAPPKGKNKHWVDGRSAKECARAWLENAPSAPPHEIGSLLSSHSHFSDMLIEQVEPEALLSFDERNGPRNADLSITARDAGGVVAITVEAKADESFDDIVAEVFDATLEKLIVNPRSGGVARLVDLAQSILPARVTGTTSVSEIRYQMLTAIAGTLTHAAALEADRAIFLVHEFNSEKTSPNLRERNAEDLNRFVARLSQGQVNRVSPGMLTGPFYLPGEPLLNPKIALYIGKAVRVVGPAV